VLFTTRLSKRRRALRFVSRDACNTCAGDHACAAGPGGPPEGEGGGVTYLCHCCDRLPDGTACLLLLQKLSHLRTHCRLLVGHGVAIWQTYIR